MSLPVVFHPIATREFDDAIAWYERKKRGLGMDYRRLEEKTIERIAETPLRFRPVHQYSRRALLRRFPYAIHFHLGINYIVILAVFHTRRDPEHLQGRL
jgi:plasmid stabilization system protein ParE